MSDIVERLRKCPWHPAQEAVEEIERLRAIKTPASAKLLSLIKAALEDAEAEIERMRARETRERLSDE